MSHRQDDLFLDMSDIETDLVHMHAYIDRLEIQMSIRRTPDTRARQNSISSSHSGASVNNSDGGDDNQAAGGVQTGKGPVHTSTPNPGSLRPDGGPLSRHIRGNPKRGGLGNNGTFYKDGQANKVNSSRPKEIKPATFDGKSSWIDFRSHFDICAELNGWSEQEKGLHLAVSLRGSAQSILGNLHGDSKKDFISLCRALEERFAPANQTELYRAQLRERRQKATETIPELGQDIRRLTNLAYSSAPIEVRETLAKEQFVDALISSDMRLRIKQSRPKDLNDAICHAVELDAFNNAEKRLQDSTDFVRATDTESSSKPKSSVESMVSKMNKVLTELRSEVKQLKLKASQNAHGATSGTVANTAGTRVTCFFCKKEVHMKKQCRKYQQWKAEQADQTKEKTKGSESSTCKISLGSTEALSRAGQSGLFVKADMNGYPLNLLIDTGATMSLVGPHIYKQWYEQQAKPSVLDNLDRPILTADGSPLNVKGTTTVSFVIKGMQFQHLVVVADVGIDGIIGLDFMEKYACSIDIQGRLLVIQGQAVKLHMEGKVGCYRVCLGEKLTVPPQSDAIAMCSVKDSHGDIVHDVGIGIVEPSDTFVKSDRGLVARTLADVKTEVPVRIMNVSDDAQQLEQGTIVAQYSPVSEVFDTVVAVTEHQDVPDYLHDLFEKAKGNLNSKQTETVRQFLVKYANLFAKDDFDLGKVESVQHEIKTGDAVPIKQPPRRLPVHMQEEVDKHVESMIQKGVVQPSSSPWASPVVLVKKKDGTTRFCIDYRKLNDITVKDAYPLPLIDQSLDHLAGAKWFSTLDLFSGYWQVTVNPNDRPKTAFATRHGLYEFSVMPFGLCNAPATFERLMERVLSGLQFDICLVYLDDIIVTARTFDEMINNLSKVFDRLSAAGFKLKAKKCDLFARKVEYLGHVITEDGIATSASKTKAIDEWSVPSNASEVRSFLGLCSYYRKFVSGFAEIASPLHALTTKGKDFKWTEECQHSFEALRRALVISPILASPNFSKSFILDTDASDKSIGAVLSQNIEGKERVCAYASRTLSKSERKYCVTRKELLAVVHFIKYFRHYLYGHKFLVRTDHSSLKWLMHFKNPENQLARWLDILSQYDFEIEHRPGRLHRNADALSRVPCKQYGRTSDTETDALQESEQVCTVTQKSPISMKSIQEADQNLQIVKGWLDNGRPDSKIVEGHDYYLKSLYSQFDRLSLVHGIICRKWDDLDTRL